MSLQKFDYLILAFLVWSQQMLHGFVWQQDQTRCCLSLDYDEHRDQTAASQLPDIATLAVKTLFLRA